MIFEEQMRRYEIANVIMLLYIMAIKELHHDHMTTTRLKVIYSQNED